MNLTGKLYLVLALAFPLSGCFSPSANLPQGEEAYRLVPPPSPDMVRNPYRVGVLDLISVRTFQEPDLSFEKLQVDAGGNIDFPLIGTIKAAGMTTVELGDEIEKGLSKRFIAYPQVVVGIVESANQKIVVEGNVVQPDIYLLQGNTTLLGALAMARGLTRVAVADEVIVFRENNGERMGAIFNIEDIREGKAPDPEIIGGDKVVVGFSALKGAYRDLIAAAPVFNVFRVLTDNNNN